MSLDFETVVYKLGKRGFRQTDSFLHECAACHERAVVVFGAAGRTGGRDIHICQACGNAQSWRNGAGLEGREADASFDLDAFLK